MKANSEKEDLVMADHEVMIFLLDHYGPELKTPSALLKHLRTRLKRSCSHERFNLIHQRFLQKYAPEGVLKK